ncbi:MAG: peptidoglycan DD-metalloendopeptidase family protein, partial [Patescibacteria group bacterium]
FTNTASERRRNIVPSYIPSIRSVTLLIGLFLLFPPIPADASVMSFMDGLLGKKTTKDEKNSQNIPLLRANLGTEQNARGGGDITIVDDSAISSDAGPLGTSIDFVDNQSDEISIYVVRKGDSISQIAKMFGVSPNTIVWANDIEGGIISDGQKLIILPVSGIQYTIKNGDTIKKISDKYKADTEEILKFNGIALDTKLIAGETIIIPDVEGTAVKQSINSLSRPTSRLYGTSGPSYDGYYIRPIAGGYKSQGLHGYNGVDLATFRGAPIIASATGDVIISRQGGWNGGYGNYIVIQHGNGTQTLYSHNNENIVSVGDRVVQGQVIGYVGNTGRSTGSHLHFEVRGAQNPF